MVSHSLVFVPHNKNTSKHPNGLHQTGMQGKLYLVFKATFIAFQRNERKGLEKPIKVNPKHRNNRPIPYLPVQTKKEHCRLLKRGIKKRKKIENLINLSGSK